MLEIITSKENKIIKLVKNLTDSKKTRDEKNMFVIEGIKTINEIPDFYEIECIVISEAFYENGQLNHCVKNKNALKSILSIVSDNLFKSISKMTTPEGILAVVHKNKFNLDRMLKENEIKNIVMLDDIRDPGNLGTIIRSADAMGMDMVITSLECTDVYSSKVTRSTMGSLFHLPIIDKVDLKGVIQTLKENDFFVYATNLKSEKNMEQLDLDNKKICMIIGNEAHGVSKELIEISDDSFKIHMKGNAESLNAGVAASIIMYELSKR